MLFLLYSRVLYSILHAHLIAKLFFTTLQREVKCLRVHSAIPLHNGRLSPICQEVVTFRDFAWTPLYSTILF